MPRFTDDNMYNRHPDECAAAGAIRQAAERLQHLLFDSYAADELPDELKASLMRLYRALRIVTGIYFDLGDTCLQEAPPPATQFQKARK